MKIGALFVQRKRCWARPCVEAYNDLGIIMRSRLLEHEHEQNLCLKVRDEHCVEQEHTFMLQDGSVVNMKGFGRYTTPRCFERIS